MGLGFFKARLEKEDMRIWLEFMKLIDRSIPFSLFGKMGP